MGTYEYPLTRVSTLPLSLYESTHTRVHTPSLSHFQPLKAYGSEWAELLLAGIDADLRKVNCSTSLDSSSKARMSSASRLDAGSHVGSQLCATLPSSFRSSSHSTRYCTRRLGPPRRLFRLCSVSQWLPLRSRLPPMRLLGVRRRGSGTFKHRRWRRRLIDAEGDQLERIARRRGLPVLHAALVQLVLFLVYTVVAFRAAKAKALRVSHHHT